MDKNQMLSPYTKTLKSIAVDFDLTITKTDGSVNKRAIKYLKKIGSLGLDLVLWTARKDERYDYAINVCKQNGLNLKEAPKEIGKIYCLYYIDDRSVPGGKVPWYRTYKYIKNEVRKLKKLQVE